jgi:hypothetical protein
MGMVVPFIVPVLTAVSVAVSAVTMVKGLKEGNLLQAVLGGVGAFTGMQALSASLSKVGASQMGSTLAADGAAGATGALGELAGADLVVNNAASIANPGAAAALAANSAPLAQQGLGQLVDKAAMPALQGGADLGLESLKAGMSAPVDAASLSLAQAPGGAVNVAGTAADAVSNVATGVAEQGMSQLDKLGGFLSDTGSGLMDGMAKFKEAGGGDLMQVGGGLLKGYADGAAAENEREFLRNEQLRREARQDQLDAARRGRVAATPTRTNYSIANRGN